MAGVFVISLALIGLSGVLLDSHRRSWVAAQADAKLSERDLRFARAQYLRRRQASGMIGLLGAAVGLGPLVPHEPWPMVLYVAAMAGACGCMLVLAALDVFATRQNLARLRSEHLAAQIKLARELRGDNQQ
jgi:hypothetical protein